MYPGGPVFQRVIPIIREFLSCFPFPKSLFRIDTVVLALLSHLEKLKKILCTDCRAELGKLGAWVEIRLVLIPFECHSLVLLLK